MKSIYIAEDNLPLAWEKAVIACWESGTNMPTEYDKPGDPNSRDATVMIHVRRPLDDPRIHRGFPGGLEDLEKYRGEVLYGVHDHWIDPAAGKWEYTYHERLRDYRLPPSRGHENGFDQIAMVIDKLKQTPYTRRAQAITWQPWKDPRVDDASCLQRLWFRIENGRLNMNVHFRSNDAFKAAFMNMYAFSELQREIAVEVGVEPGEYIHIADSFHIYGSYFKEFDGFLKMTTNKSFGDRTFTEDYALEFFIDGCKQLLAEEDMPEAPRLMVANRLQELTGRMETR